MCVHICILGCVHVCKYGGGKEGEKGWGGGEYNDKLGIATCILVIQVRGERRYIHVCEKEHSKTA